MAIHIWRDGAYRSVDLAQYGENGQLSGAYQWRDGAWRTLWEAVTWPATGEWAGGPLTSGGTVVATFTIPTSGEYTVTWAVTLASGNLIQAQIERPGGVTNGDLATGTSTATVTGHADEGFELLFRAAGLGSGATSSGGTWTVTPV